MLPFSSRKVAQLPGPNQIPPHLFGVSGQTELRINNAKPCLCLLVCTCPSRGRPPTSFSLLRACQFFGTILDLGPKDGLIPTVSMTALAIRTASSDDLERDTQSATPPRKSNVSQEHLSRWNLLYPSANIVRTVRTIPGAACLPAFPKERAQRAPRTPRSEV